MVCWCVGVLCVGVLVCWCVGVLCVGVLVYVVMNDEGMYSIYAIYAIYAKYDIYAIYGRGGEGLFCRCVPSPSVGSEATCFSSPV